MIHVRCNNCDRYHPCDGPAAQRLSALVDEAIQKGLCGTPNHVGDDEMRGLALREASHVCRPPETPAYLLSGAAPETPKKSKPSKVRSA